MRMMIMKGEIVRLTSNGKSKSSYGGHFRFIEKAQSCMLAENWVSLLCCSLLWHWQMQEKGLGFRCWCYLPRLDTIARQIRKGRTSSLLHLEEVVIECSTTTIECVQK